MMMFSGKSALVTGGASGIGEAVVHALAAQGANVLVIDRNAQLADAVAKACADYPGSVSAIAADVADDAQMRDAVGAAVQRFGGLNIAVNSAGIAHNPAPFQTFDDAHWHHIFNVNLLGIVHAMKWEVPAILAAGGGAICNVASGAGLFAAPMMSVYGASKHAVLGLTRSAAIENAASGIRINAVCPGLIDTPMSRPAEGEESEWDKFVAIPMNRVGSASEVADVAVWLCSDQASYVIGQSIAVDGGIHTG